MEQHGRACVIFNPSSGKGRGQRLLRAIRAKFDHALEFMPIPAAGAGESTARSALDAGFRTLIAAGGDGTVHDVANAVLNANHNGTLLGVWPLGSANDFAYALKIDKPWEHFDRLTVRAVDAGLIETPCGRRRWFVNSLGVGFNGAVTLEARKIKWLRGMLLYGIGIIQAMRKHYRHPVLRVAGDNVRETPSLSLTVNLGKREGGFPLTPNAEVDDGLFDVLHVGAISRWELLKHLPRMATGKIPDDHPMVWKSRTRKLTIESPEPMRIHLDGEFFCHPEDGITQANVLLFPAALRVQTG